MVQVCFTFVCPPAELEIFPPRSEFLSIDAETRDRRLLSRIAVDEVPATPGELSGARRLATLIHLRRQLPQTAVGERLGAGESVQQYLLIALGGAVGAMLRHGIGAPAAQQFGPRFPVGTLLITLPACFLIGLTLVFLEHHAGVNPAWRYLITSGFIVAYSTVSTFESEVWSDFLHGAFWVALLCFAVSLTGRFIMVALGALTARAIA